MFCPKCAFTSTVTIVSKDKIRYDCVQCGTTVFEHQKQTGFGYEYASFEEWLSEQQVDPHPKFQETIDKHFWELA